eukprot:5335603-Amphidinium_carterae.1
MSHRRTKPRPTQRMHCCRGSGTSVTVRLPSCGELDLNHGPLLGGGLASAGCWKHFEELRLLGVSFQPERKDAKWTALQEQQAQKWQFTVDRISKLPVGFLKKVACDDTVNVGERHPCGMLLADTLA